MRWLSFAAASLIILLWHSAPAQESPWPMFRHDRQHTGRTPYTGLAVPVVDWTFTANDAITSSPSIGHNGTIYVGAGGYYQGGFDSSLYAINPDGTLKWQFKTERNVPPSGAAGIFSSPAIGPDGIIYIGSLDGHLYAIEDSVTYGKMLWRTSLGDWPVYSSPTVADNGTIYVGSLNFNFYAINPNGSILWNYPTGWCVFSSPILGDDGMVYVGSKDHNLYAFRDSIPYGSIVWKFPAGVFYDGHLIDCSPAMGDDGTIYVGSDPYGAFGQTPVPVDTVFFAVNPDGSTKWKFAMKDGAESSPAVGPDGTIYVGSYDSCLYAIEDRGTEGFLKWKFVTGGPIDASPTVDGDGTIYIGSGDSVLYALNPDGSVKWSFPTEGKIESSVTIDGEGHLFFGSFDGRLYALGNGAPDVGTEAIIVPDSVQVNTVYFPTAAVRNFRSSTVNIDVACIIEKGGVAVYGDTVSVAGLGDADTALVIFSPWTVGSVTGETFDVMVLTLAPGDENANNDTLVNQTISVAQVSFICADVDGNNAGPDIADLVYLVNYMFSGGPPPPFLNAADMDGSGELNIADLVYLVGYMFNSGPAPTC